MRSLHPRWVLGLALLSILPLVILGFGIEQRLTRVNEQRYEQEKVSARYAGELAADYIQQALREYFRPRREILTYNHMKGERAFESALRKLYFTSNLLDYPQFVEESVLLRVDDTPASSVAENSTSALAGIEEHDCEKEVMRLLRGRLLDEGRERMGYEPVKQRFSRSQLIVEDEESVEKAAPLRWVRVAISDFNPEGCALCSKELGRLGGKLDDESVAVLMLSFALPGRESIQPGMFGALVPLKDLLPEIVWPAFRRWGEDGQALPRHGLRLVDGQRELILPRKLPADPRAARALQEGQAFSSQLLLGEGSPWRLEVVALSGFDLGQMRAENQRWSLALIASAVLLAGGALWMGRTFYQQVEHARLRAHLLNNISHELKTPLSLVRLYTETLASGRTRNEEERTRFLGIIGRESKRLSHLIDNLLDIQRIEQDRKQYSYAHVRPDRVARETVEAYRYQLAEDGFDVKLDVDEDLPLLYLDEEAIAQALINLLDNAAKYSDTVKEIRVRVGRRDGEICIAVQDRGIGIPKHEQSKIFQSFYRVEKTLVHNVKGSGLGLAVVAHVARGHGGRVEVDSTPGKGSTFVMCLPVDFDPESA
jgi:signal transduction histidine kinase